MKQISFSEAGKSPCSQDMLWNPKVRYHFHNNPSLFTVQDHINPVLEYTFYLLNVDFNIIVQPASRSSKRPLSFKCSHKNSVRIPVLSNA